MLERERLKITQEGQVVTQPEPELRPPKEVASWLERIERGDDVQLTKPVIDDQTGQVLVTAPSAQQPKIVLPLTKAKLIQGLKAKTTEAIRWLAEWCLRLIKMKPTQVKLAQE